MRKVEKKKVDRKKRSKDTLRKFSVNQEMSQKIVRFLQRLVCFLHTQNSSRNDTFTFFRPQASSPAIKTFAKSYVLQNGQLPSLKNAL